MHDAIKMERAGTPAAVVISDPFQPLAARFAENLGMPGYPPIMVPHPVATRNEEYLRRLAQQIAPAVIAHLTGARRADFVAS